MPPAGLMGLVCYAGADEAAAAAAFAPLLSLGTVRMSQIDEKPYADVLEEAHPPPGVRAMASSTSSSASTTRSSTRSSATTRVAPRTG